MRSLERTGPRAKSQAGNRPFGTQLDVRAVGYEWINHSIKPTQLDGHDFRVTVGGAACQQPYRISLFNVSAMSWKSFNVAPSKFNGKMAG